MEFQDSIRDRMIPIERYTTVNENLTLKEAVSLLRRSYCEMEAGICSEAGPRTIFVLNENDKLVGILDFHSILGSLIPEITGGLTAKLSALGVQAAFAEAGISSPDDSKVELSERITRNAQVKVKDIMLKIRGEIVVGETLSEALVKMFSKKLTVLPVYDSGKLVGVLRDEDLFLAVADFIQD